ncbi:MAG: VWA domain-containing protein [Pontiellaceae bacterium]|nr:VWA domain-containing protein [Pontiellaceae bacterium]
MNTNIPNEQFMAWVEQYLDDTLQPDAAEQLLHLLQDDPERLNQFCRQLQMQRLLEEQNAVPSGADAVLQRIQEKAAPKIIRPRWNRILYRAAAVLTVTVGVGLVTQHAVKEKAAQTEAEYDSNSESRPQMNLKKPIVKVKKTDGSSTGNDEGKAVSPESRLRRLNLPMSPSPHSLSSPSIVGSPVMPPANNTETYASIEENGWKMAGETPLSTFSIDVDTASYANVRRFLNQGQLPPADAVRVEEMINYFEYDYAAPKGETTFSTAMALQACPWNPTHKLLRVGLQGRKPDEGSDKPSNLVFLLDVSGSMDSEDKLPLLKKGFTMMVNALGAQDRVAIVVYAGSSGLVLDSTSAADKETIIGAMERLSAGGSTAGGAGIELAYRVAADHYIPGGINRVILATDGDFNVGISDINGLQKLIEEKRETGVFLSVLGFGTGNLKDSTMETLADKGNGNYFYIDSEREADKVLVKQLTANMETIAKDVKIQIEFNPKVVRSYRLIGYENRVMAAQDFADDQKDAGEIGAGHQVTALYELITTDAPATQDGVALKYAQTEESSYSAADEMLTLKLRYKEPEGSVSKLISFPLKAGTSDEAMDASFRWVTAVAAFGQYLRQSENLVRYSLEEIKEMAESAVGEDPYGYRREFIRLLDQAAQLEGCVPTDSKYPVWQYRN